MIAESHEGTNTYLIGVGRQRLLIDTGQGERSWSNLLSSTLQSEHATISQGLITHWHPDHVGGIKDLLALCPEATIYKNQPTDRQENISDGQIFKTEGATLRAFHCPGHTTDHMAFILEEENAMFTGDNVLGHGTAVFEDLATYLKSLERMRQQCDGMAYPGHGELIEDGRAKIKEYIEHRQQREQEVMAVLEEAGSEGRTPMEIVKVIYRDYPENLYEPAAKGVLQILQKLEGEGQVKEGERGKWRVLRKAAL